MTHELGPNMRLLRESQIGDLLRPCATAGPGDLLAWELSVTVDSDGMPVELIGRGTDMEAAAAALIPLLRNHAPATLGDAERAPGDD